MLKVLLASPEGNISGGIARWTGHILNYYGSLNDKPVELDFFDTARSVNIGESMPLLTRIRYGIKDYRSSLQRFRAEIRKKKYDVLHMTTSASWGLLKDILFIRAAQKAGVKTVVHYRFGRTPQLSKAKNWEWYLLCKVVRLSDKSIFIDKASYQTMRNHGFENVCLLPNPISPAVFDAINKCNVTERQHNKILFVGHCIKAKGVFELIQVCKEINDCTVRMVGSISEALKEELLQLFGDNDRISIVGEESYENIINEMLRCGVFVLPSYTEGFPNVILEAMACGCPIVATDVGAIPEMLDIENGDNYGICVKPQDVEGLKSALQKMLDDRTYATLCGFNAQKRVNDLYSMPRVWEQMVNVWKSA